MFKLSSYKRILAKKIACLEWIKTSWSYFLKLCIQSYSVTYCAVIETKNKEIPLFFNWIPVVFFGSTFKAKKSYHSTPTCHISSQKWNTLFEIYYLLHEYLELLDDYLAISIYDYSFVQKKQMRSLWWNFQNNCIILKLISIPNWVRW